MRRVKVLFTWLAVLTVTAMAQAAPALRGKCVAVNDGDTIKIQVNQQIVEIRLEGVGCPEMKQAFGDNAKEFTHQWAYGRNLTVYKTGTDKYHRTLGWVFYGKRCLNRDLVYNGIAWWYRQSAPNNTRLKNLEAYARSKRRGLWKSPNPMPPWVWRETRRKSH